MQNLSGGTLFKCYPGPFSSVSYNSASSLSLSGWWHISRMGFSSVEMCTGPVPLGGNLTTGFGSTVLFLLVAGIGICTGAIGGLEMIAWFMTL